VDCSCLVKGGRGWAGDGSVGGIGPIERNGLNGREEAGGSPS